MTVAETLRQILITSTGKTVTEMVREIGMSRPNLSNVINGNIALSVTLALRLEAMGHINARRMLYDQIDEQIDEVIENKRVKRKRQ